MMRDGLQIYEYGEFSWNIEAAIKLVASREAELRDITPWFERLSGHAITEERWPIVDLLQPLIMAPLYGTGEIWLIDGWHRVRRALAEEITALPVHVLSVAEERKVRGYGGDKPS